jgi:hypothetical protein
MEIVNDNWPYLLKDNYMFDSYRKKKESSVDIEDSRKHNVYTCLELNDKIYYPLGGVCTFDGSNFSDIIEYQNIMYRLTDLSNKWIDENIDMVINEISKNNTAAIDKFSFKLKVIRGVIHLEEEVSRMTFSTNLLLFSEDYS